MNTNLAWVLKYAPKTFDDLLLPQKEKDYFSKLTYIPNNLLFIGSGGTGKTSLANILIEKFAPNSSLVINASDESGIDIVRTKIKDFISVSSIDGADKVIFLNEVDGFSPAAQKALLVFMEEYLDSVKFILTANNKHKLIETIISRSPPIEFIHDFTMVKTRMIQILKAENITVAKEDAPALIAIIKKYYTDIRRTIGELQRACQSGTFISTAITSDLPKKIYDALKSKTDCFSIRQTVIDNTAEFYNDYHYLMRELFDIYVKECNLKACLLIADHMASHSLVLDTEVNFSALIFNLSTL